jgi:hypothetical protein
MGIVPMPGYRFYSVDASGHISVPPIESEHTDDSAAVLHARSFILQETVEVWQRGRRVAVISPQEKSR